MFRSNLGLTGRILVSFWITLVLIILILATLFMLDRENDEFNKHIPPIKINDMLVRNLLTQPYSEVVEWFSALPRKETRRIFLIKNSKEILDRPLPGVLKRINRRLSNDRPFIHHKRFNKIAVGRIMDLPNGEQVRILVKSRLNPHGKHHMFAHNWFLMIIMAVIVSGFISYLLARYISKPILHLRRATQDIAAGDLSIRVENEVKANHGEVFLLAKDFDKMAEKLERTISSHKHLIQDISHELRSPVARLQLALELAKKRLEIEDSQPDIARIEKECENINSIINTLLNLPSYELDPQVGLQDSVDIPELVSSICEDLNYSSSQHVIHCDINTSNHCVITANQQLLRSAIENVIKNAFHYHQGNDPILMEVSISDSQVCIECSDKGPGIPEAKLSQIFKPFYRVSEARDRASGGYGLGLAITKRAIDLHGGSVEAFNKEEGGLCVRLCLPITES